MINYVIKTLNHAAQSPARILFGKLAPAVINRTPKPLFDPLFINTAIRTTSTLNLLHQVNRITPAQCGYYLTHITTETEVT